MAVTAAQSRNAGHDSHYKYTYNLWVSQLSLNKSAELFAKPNYVSPAIGTGTPLSCRHNAALTLHHNAPRIASSV